VLFGAGLKEEEKTYSPQGVGAKRSAKAEKLERGQKNIELACFTKTPFERTRGTVNTSLRKGRSRVHWESVPQKRGDSGRITLGIKKGGYRSLGSKGLDRGSLLPWSGCCVRSVRTL